MTPQQITNAVSEVTGVSVEDILSSCRKKDFVDARKIAQWFIYYDAPFTTYGDIQKFFGMKNHTSVLHNIFSFEDRCETDELFAMSAAAVRFGLYGGGATDHFDITIKKGYILKNIDGLIQQFDPYQFFCFLSVNYRHKRKERDINPVAIKRARRIEQYVPKKKVPFELIRARVNQAAHLFAHGIDVFELSKMFSVSLYKIKVAHSRNVIEARRAERELHKKQFARVIPEQRIERDKKALYLWRNTNLSTGKIGKMLNISSSTVERILHKATA